MESVNLNLTSQILHSCTIFAYIFFKYPHNVSFYSINVVIIDVGQHILWCSAYPIYDV